MTDRPMDRLTKPPETRSGEWGSGALPAPSDPAVWQGGVHPHRVLPMIVFDMDGALLDGRMLPARRLLNGVSDMLAALEEQATLCVLAEGPPQHLRQACEAVGILDRLAERAALAPGVPKAPLIREWMEVRGLPRTLVVSGDSVLVDAGREAGAVTLAVTYGGESPGRLSRADAVAASVAEAWRYCERFCRNGE